MPADASHHAIAVTDLPVYRRGAGRLRYVLAYVLGVLITVASLAGSALFRLAGAEVIAHRIDRCGARFLLCVLGVRLRVAGLEQVREGSVLVANHPSALDLPALLAALPVPARFSGRVRLAEAGRLADAGFLLLAFPEGRRGGEGALLDFELAAFQLARDANLGVTPVAIRNSGRLMPRGRCRIEPGTIEVLIGEPLPASAAPTARELSLLARQRVADLLQAPSPEA